MRGPEPGRFLEANRAHWDELVAIHARSAFYDLEGFRAGRCTLLPVEVAELGDVAGKRLLHLQCHFGLDTLSWARRGAIVTGVDFSERAISLAAALAAETGIPARFLCRSVYDLPDELAGAFDVVFTSYGVLCWLPDLPAWAAGAARCLRPDGVFYLVEDHPAAAALDDGAPAGELRVRYPYFHSPEPETWTGQGSYADRDARVAHATTHEWCHGMGDVLNALLAAGLRVEFLHEFPFCAWRRLPGMERGGDGCWRLPGGERLFPFTFSLRARRG